VVRDARGGLGVGLTVETAARGTKTFPTAAFPRPSTGFQGWSAADAIPSESERPRTCSDTTVGRGCERSEMRASVGEGVTAPAERGDRPGAGAFWKPHQKQGPRERHRKVPPALRATGMSLPTCLYSREMGVFRVSAGPEGGMSGASGRGGDVDTGNVWRRRIGVATGACYKMWSRTHTWRLERSCLP
jgi:hypothetical protein